MRISDWSSDVCSSDLAGLIGEAERRFEQLAARDEAGGAVNREKDDDHQTGDDAQDMALIGEAIAEKFGDGQRAEALGLFAQPRRDEHPVRPRAEEEPDADPAFGEPRDIDGARSEEHTSELQPLMRISYAVLCLKKKN